MRGRQGRRGLHLVDLRGQGTDLPELAVGDPCRDGHGDVPGGPCELATHGGIVPVGSGEQGPGRGNAVGRFSGGEQRGRGHHGPVVRQRPGDGQGMHPQESVDGRPHLAHGLGPVTEHGAEVHRDLAGRSRRGQGGGPGLLLGRLLHRPVQFGLQRLAILGRQRPHEVANRRCGDVRRIGQHGHLSGEGSVHLRGVAPRIAGDLGQAADEEQRHQRRTAKDIDPPIERSATSATAGGKRQHRRVRLLPAFSDVQASSSAAGGQSRSRRPEARATRWLTAARRAASLATTVNRFSPGHGGRGQLSRQDGRASRGLPLVVLLSLCPCP